ncbi:GNAT family N-acetyltransferase [Mycobacterium ostraviense]|uniref:Lysine N-acyltransferase MbtK n=1 Tax=Mycobacterium ostraviense TaxID=2738409 RepID=A0A164AGG2_9MYCO|nr:GNAT family N-acetyltransferase [Mycobacterium ostraviense]KZS62452.1 siderophore biosynthesis protein [Mycobacterium ostraviense]UGT90164.1 acetyltransferase [Mycobacterium ostraviense]
MSEADALFPRQLTDLTDEVRNVPPPPTPAVPSPYAFRLADPDTDAEMIAEWMSRPHLARAWECVWPAARWQRYLRAQLDGNYSRPFVGSLDGQYYGYLELYWAAKDLISTLYESDPYDLGIHAATADPNIISLGVAQLLLPHFVASVLNAEPQCRRIIFDPDYRSKGIRHFCENGGCVFLGEHELANRRVALYVLPRTLDDVPALRQQ